MADTKSHNPVATYIIVALILGVITYIEFAMVEYPQAWLGPTWTLFWLVLLSVVKFVMVIMFFMHLKEDNPTYTGFFSSGMFISMATFVALTAMFVLPRSVAATRPDSVLGAAAKQEVPQNLLDNIASAGQSRGAAAVAQNPRPADRSVTFTPPSAANDGSSYQLSMPDPFGAAAQQAAEAEQTTEATEVQEAAEASEPAATSTEASADSQTSGETASSEAATEPTAEAEPETSGEAPASEVAAVTWDVDNGNTVYGAHCVACHQASGQGIPGAFPPLADHAVDIYAAGGHEYLMDVLLFGLQGSVTVNGMAYNGLMPAWQQLSDGDIADVINHILTAWDTPPDDFVPYQAADIKEQRGKGLSATDVHGLREQLGL